MTESAADNLRQNSFLKEGFIMEVPIWEKTILTLKEASAYSGLGINKLRDMSNEKNCPFVLFVGAKRMIKRKQLDEYLAKCYSV